MPGYDITLRAFDGSTLKAFDETESPPILIDGFRCRVRPDGSCETATLRVRRDRLPELAARVIIRIEYDGVTLFQGPVITLPPDTSTGAPGPGSNDTLEVVEIAGGEEFFRTALVGHTFTEGTELQAVAQRVINEGSELPAVLNTTLALDTDTETAIFYKPFSVMLDTLRELAGLAESGAYSFGVNQNLRAFFQETSTTPASIAWTEATLEIERLPLSARALTTRVTLVISGGMAGERPYRIRVGRFNTDGLGFSEYHEYVPQPITHTYEDADHADYLAERAFRLEGVDVFLGPTDPTYASGGLTETLDNITASSGEHRDGDPDTFASITDATAEASIQIQASTAGSATYLNLIVGYVLAYSASYAEGAAPDSEVDHYPGRVTVRQTGQALPGGGNRIETDARYGVPNETEVTVVRAVLPPDVRQKAVNQLETTTITSDTSDDNRGTIILRFVPDAVTDVADLQIISFYPLILDTSFLDSIAAGKIHKPGAETPSRLRVGYYVAARKFVTITGYQGGGDTTFEATSFEYSLTPGRGFETIITLNTTDSVEVSVQELLRTNNDRALYAQLMSERN